jgi:hypothetical protein
MAIPMSEEVRAEIVRRWEQRHPDEAAADSDPRSLTPCIGDECQTFAWRGYEPYCGWCYEEGENGARP